MIFRFARFQDKSIEVSPAKKRIARYCKKVTLLWCGFFILNGSVSACTAFAASDVLWSIYNGGVSYILMGLLFTGEYIIRKQVNKKMPKAVALSQFTKDSRPGDTVLCYEGSFSDGVYKTWKDFIDDTCSLRRIIEKTGGETWLLHCEDYWYFLAAFTALLQCKKEILLSANVSPAYVDEIRQGGMPFLTDLAFPDEAGQGEAGRRGAGQRGVFQIPAILAGPPHGEADPPGDIPVINALETSIVMYTSGSTGRPKAVKQRLVEFENDNLFILSKWGEEFLERKLCSTVSQHHIYGLLFSIMLPFTVGVPFRRKRIEFPGEFEKLTDTAYMIITVPAFLKRACEVETPGGLSLQSPWIFTSGGALPFETAQKTSDIFGFWPLEVYGSTETSGIAWRRSKDGMEWTPFDNAEIWKNQDGCLVIRSPYIKDPLGFETADLAEILAGGRFLLKGRIDSVVKIEEKRVSLTEIESRLLDSGLAGEVCVIPMEDKRQYLAAALVLNTKGKDRFAAYEKHDINKYFRTYLAQFFENSTLPKKWRYPESLPQDAQGKKKRDEIRALFAKGSGGEAPGAEDTGDIPKITEEKIIEKTDTSLIVSFTVPAESPYFDGHFPEFKLLPAAAQIAIIIHMLSRHFAGRFLVREIKRVKFQDMIRPGASLVLSFSFKKETGALSFSITGSGGKPAYSSGSLFLSGEP
jgi:acyl-CoA synthetase (AMP-forming)/AMP-acid ligase II/3-hydroxymyristoyl/3-hydroxydecanoyl-(acyl carrier protein) dehydratase